MSFSRPSGSDSAGGKPEKAKNPAWMGSGSSTQTRRSAQVWKASAQKERDHEQRQRLMRAIAVGIAGLLVIAFLVYLLSRPQATPLMVVRAPAYPLRSPPLALAQEDEALLEKISPKNVRVSGFQVKLEDAKGTLENLRRVLGQASRGRLNLFNWRNNAVMVYVAGHGAVDEKGRACLIPSAADPFDSRTWLAVSEVLQVLRDEPGLGGKRKVLFLDCQRVASAWRSGLLDNRFADKLPQAVQDAGDPTLYVIAAAGPGEVAWPAPELRGSVFGHFVARGLRGEANPTEGTVSLGQLFRYVSSNVEAYVRQRRGALQQPMLLHATVSEERGGSDATEGAGTPGELAAADDFTLAYIDTRALNESFSKLRSAFDPLEGAERVLGRNVQRPGESKSNERLHSSLRDVWELYERRRGAVAGASLPAAAAFGYIGDPVAWAGIQQRLAAIEERLFAGEEYQTGLQGHIDQLAGELDPGRWRPAAELPALNQIAASWSAAINGQSPPSSGGNLLEAYLDPKEPDAAKKRELVARVPRLRLVQDIYARLARPGQAASPSELAAAAEMLALRPAAGAGGDSIEAHFVTLVDRWSKLAGLLPPGTQIARAFETRQWAERAATPADFRVHYALEPLVNAADVKRRLGEDQLYLGDAAESQRGTLDTALAEYQQAVEQGEKLSEALRLRDEIWSELPLVAEWQMLRGRLITTRRTDDLANLSLIDLLDRSIALAERLEQVFAARDDKALFSDRYGECIKQLNDLSRSWRQLRSLLDDIGRPQEVEETYKRGEDVGDVELALRTPLMAGRAGEPILERYLNTLKEWAADAAPVIDAPADNGGRQAERAALDSQRQEFLRQLHRALDYEFSIPYQEHRLSVQWSSGDIAPDAVFARATGGRESLWNRLQRLLDRYDDAMQSAPPKLWNSTLSALVATQELRAWDRRVRVAAPWLCSFQADLRLPDVAQASSAHHPTPARWLQQYDTGHLVSWHAFRVVRDFWGSGVEERGGAPPFFAAAVGQCIAAAPDYLPLRYDVPGGDFTERSQPALAALARWNPIKLPPRLALRDSTPSGTKFNIEIEPTSTAAEFKLPAGVAALSLGSEPPGGVRVFFDESQRQPVRPVNLPVTGGEPLRLAASAAVEGSSPPSGLEVAARLWYRGHVRTQRSSIGSSAIGFVESQYQRRPYAVPTVEVRGTDAPRGAVMFIFDCSASMTDPDGRFNVAKNELQNALGELDRAVGNQLRVGLMVYGRRTAVGGQAPMYYRQNAMPDARDNLTELGRNMQRNNPLFAQQFPHPDRDVELLLAIQDGSPALALAKLNELQMEQCVGMTPLYYSITHAVQTAFRNLPQGIDGARQIVVISDGVNMPYDSSGGRMGSTGLSVNNADRTALEQALAGQQVQVTVLLFGGQQAQALNQIANDHANFKIENIPNARGIARAIRASFPKTGIELVSRSAGAAGQRLEFQTPSKVAGWPQDELLRREPDRRAVRLTFPGEAGRLEKDVDLVGGEKVVLEYDPRRGKGALVFVSEGRQAIATEEARAVGRIAEPVRTLTVDVLDPIRNRGGIDMTFPFRIRDKQWEERFTPRPRYIWAEIEARGAGTTSGVVFPCLDATWEDQTQFPVLQVPLDGWPPLARRAALRLWIRYDEPQTTAREPLPRGRNRTLEAAGDRWTITQSGGEAGEPRNVVVTLEPSAENRSFQKLIEQAVWLSPPADEIHRQFANDGSSAEYEFTYSRSAAGEGDLEMSVVSKRQFQQGAYAVEMEFEIAN